MVDSYHGVGGGTRGGWGDKGWVLFHSLFVCLFFFPFLFMLLSFGLSCPVSFLSEYSMVPVVSVSLFIISLLCV